MGVAFYHLTGHLEKAAGKIYYRGQPVPTHFTEQAAVAERWKVVVK
jgi:hypothetical protein